jgi:hypothetical protein
MVESTGLGFENTLAGGVVHDFFDGGVAAFSG